ncbi:hypothetical protein BHM03_00030310 [Ensete ventricosum]|nr:hypothetical protein BHM03_00030310 [Ensete ventricosum]
MAGCSQGYWLGATGVWRCQRDARCRDRRSRCMEMRRGVDRINDDEMEDHKT